MKHIHPFLLLVTIALASCESDEVTTTSGSKKLEILPRSLEGEQYVEYTFKAHVTNMPIQDGIYYWDFDEGRGLNEQSWKVDTTFYQSKVHYVKVKAVDAITEEVLGFDSIRVDIRPPVHFVDVFPKTFDNEVRMEPDGSLLDAISFVANTSVPSHNLIMKWDFGDGSAIKESFANNYSISHKFPGPGNYMVIVKAYEKAPETYIGTDTSTVNIRFPDFSVEELFNSVTVAVYLALDSTSPITKDSLFSNPLRVQFPLRGNTLALRDGTSYSVQYHETAEHDTLTGTISSDLRIIPSLRVSVNDSYFTSDNKLIYTFELHDLQLFAVTPLQIIYKAPSPILADFAKNIMYYSKFGNYSAGFFHPAVLIVPAAATPGCFGLVIFDR